METAALGYTRLSTFWPCMLYVCVFVYVCMCMYVCVCVCMCVYVLEYEMLSINYLIGRCSWKSLVNYIQWISRELGYIYREKGIMRKFIHWTDRHTGMLYIYIYIYKPINWWFYIYICMCVCVLCSCKNALHIVIFAKCLSAISLQIL